MEPLLVFIVQFLWFLLVWCLITYFVLWPWSATLSPDARLSVFVAPQMFRVLGLGLLVPNLSPGMPVEFAISTATGDSLTALLAASAFFGLHRAATVHAILVSRSGSREPIRDPTLDRRGESTVCQIGHVTPSRTDSEKATYESVELSSDVPLRLRGLRGGR